MKNWLLYFFAVFAITVTVPFVSEKAAVADPVPKITFFSGGEIKELSAEEFALCVLAAESELACSFESKKALAVSARSLAAYIDFNGYKHQEFDICSDPECCLRIADPDSLSQPIYEECKKAVEETRGEVFQFERLPAAALFTYCAGSGTRASTELSYLCAVSEPQGCDVHITEHSFSFSQIASALPELSSCTPEQLVKNSFIAYDASGKCSFGVFNGICLDASSLASSLSLPCSEFIFSFTENGAEITCFGAGNGFGLNLCGAERMARAGKDYDEIISFYYPNLKLNKIY